MPAAAAAAGRRAPPFRAVALLLLGVGAGGCDRPPAAPPEPPAPSEPTVASVALTPADTVLVEGEAVRLVATVRDSSGAPLAGRAVRWEVFPDGIVTLSSDGWVRARALGVARIVAEADGQRDTALVDVRVRFRALSAGAAHTCAITTRNSAYCWGGNAEGRLGNGTVRPTATPTRVASAASFLQLSAGGQLTCALTQPRTVCWGSNRSGQLGSPSKDDALSPVGVANEPWLAGVATFAMHSCGIGGSDNYVYCWGADWAGQLGDGGTGGRWPHPVPGELAFRAVDVGGLFSCAVTPSGAVLCWGSNHVGQLGRPDAPEECTWHDGSPLPCARLPVPVSGAVKLDTIAAGLGHACGLTGAGEAYCWGDNRGGQLGIGTTDPVWEPTRVGGGLVFAMISAGDRHTCGLTADGTAWCWGGSGGAPQPVDTPLRFTWITASRGGEGRHTCGLATDGIAYCWGSNASGQLGVGILPEGSETPLRVLGQP